MRKCSKAKCKLHPQWENAGNGISGPLHFNIFWGGWGGGAFPQNPSSLQLRHSVPRPLISYAQQLEILVTAQILCQRKPCILPVINLPFSIQGWIVQDSCHNSSPMIGRIGPHRANDCFELAANSLRCVIISRHNTEIASPLICQQRKYILTTDINTELLRDSGQVTTSDKTVEKTEF